MLVYYHSEKCLFPRSPLHRVPILLLLNVKPRVAQEVLGTRTSRLRSQHVLARIPCQVGRGRGQSG